MGLPNQEVRDVVQLNNGKMLFLNKFWPAIYDGKKWKELPIQDDIETPYIRAITDSKNNIWLGAGYVDFKTRVYKDNKWQEIPNDNKDSHFFFLKDTIRVVSIDFVLNEIGDSVFLAKCHQKGLLFYDGDWKKITLPQLRSESILHDLEFIDNKLYTASSQGIFIYDRKTVKFLEPEKIGAPSNKVLSIAKYESKNIKQLWFLGDTWIGYLENNKLKIVDRFNLIPYSNSQGNYFFLKVFEKDVFFGNRSIICYLEKRKGKTEPLTTKKGFITEGGTQVIEDREKNIWITTYRGVIKLRRKSFSVLNTADGLLSNEVTSVKQLKDGTMVFGYNDGIGFYNKNKIENISYKDIPEVKGASRRIYEMNVDSNDVVYFAAGKIGIGRLTRDKKIKWYRKSEIRDYYCFYKDEKHFFIGTYKTLLKIENEKVVDVPVKSKTRYYIKKIIKQDDNTLLLCSDKGILIYKIKENKIEHVNGSRSTYNLLKISENKYLAAGYYCLYSFDGKTAKKTDLNGNKIDEPIYFIKRDKKNNIWFGTSSGVYIWDGEDLINVSTKDGLPHNETNRDAGFCDKEGNFWVGTARGLVKFETVPQKPDTTKPFLEFNSFEDFKGNLHRIKNREIERKYDENSFALVFNGLSFIDENKLEYEISFTDHHYETVNHFTQTDNKYRISNLVPGEYTFTVRVKNPYGVLSDPSSVRIVIAPPYYKAYWFILLMMGVVIFVAIFIQNFFHQRSYSKRLKKEVDERTKSLNISNKKYRIISETIEEITWNFNKDLELDYVSPTVKKLLGYSPEALQKLDEQKSIVERFCEYFEEFDIEKLKKESIVTEFKYVTKSNKTLNFEIFTTPVLNHNKFQGVIGVTREISQRKARERVKSAAIIQTVEVERRRIARELHDNLGQILASIKLRLEVFRIKNSEDKDIGEAYEQLSLVKKELKTIIENLNPLPYGKIDLIDALRDICETHRRKKIINTEFVLESNVEYVEMKEDHRLMIYRIVQEALTNAILYSYAEEIRIEVEKEDNEFRLRVVDNGRGFEMGRMKEIEGFGFQNMRQRASVLGAELNIESEEGKGTVISLKI